MKTYSFTFRLDLDPDKTGSQRLLDKIYAHFDDGTFGVSCGQTYLHVDREAENLEEALWTATRSLKALNLKVKELVFEGEDFENLFVQSIGP